MEDYWLIGLCVFLALGGGYFFKSNNKSK